MAVRKRMGPDEPQYNLKYRKMSTPRVVEMIEYKIASSELELQGCE